MEKNFINAITKELEEKYTFNIVVSIECTSIHLQNCHNLEVIKVEETETTIDIDTSDMCFTIGKNYTELSYNEYENEYTFNYENGVVITITII